MKSLWNTTNAIGKEGEAAISNLLYNSNLTFKDVSGDRHYQNLDVDFILNPTNPTLLEIKTDTKAAETGNLCLELIADFHSKKIGWFKLTAADWLAFYIPQLDFTVFVKTNELRQLYNDNPLQFRHFQTHFQEREGRVKDAQCVLIPAAEIKQNCSSYRLIQGQEKNDLSFLLN